MWPLPGGTGRSALGARRAWGRHRPEVHAAAVGNAGSRQSARPCAARPPSRTRAAVPAGALRAGKACGRGRVARCPHPGTGRGFYPASAGPGRTAATDALRTAAGACASAPGRGKLPAGKRQRRPNGFPGCGSIAGAGGSGRDAGAAAKNDASDPRRRVAGMSQAGAGSGRQSDLFLERACLAFQPLEPPAMPRMLSGRFFIPAVAWSCPSSMGSCLRRRMAGSVPAAPKPSTTPGFKDPAFIASGHNPPAAFRCGALPPASAGPPALRMSRIARSALCRVPSATISAVSASGFLTWPAILPDMALVRAAYLNPPPRAVPPGMISARSTA